MWELHGIATPFAAVGLAVRLISCFFLERPRVTLSCQRFGRPPRKTLRFLGTPNSVDGHYYLRPKEHPEDKQNDLPVIRLNLSMLKPARADSFFDLFSLPHATSGWSQLLMDNNTCTWNTQLCKNYLYTVKANKTWAFHGSRVQMFCSNSTSFSAPQTCPEGPHR